MPIPEDVTGFELDADVRQELKSLPKTLADDVARNLVMVARLLDSEPEEAYQFSRVALRLASRVAAVREAAGFASYMTQRYSEALTEFRAARRMTGRADLWPVMADCERGLGRPERALAMAGEPEVKQLDKAGQVEMRLVAAGARSDMEQYDAAVVTLQSPELASSAVHPWTARLRYAYAEALIAAGRADEARDWFAKAAEADTEGSTNASERLAEIDGVEFTDTLDPELDEDETESTDAPAKKRGGGDNADDRVIFEDEEDVEEFYDEDDLEIDEDFDGVVPERAQQARDTKAEDTESEDTESEVAEAEETKAAEADADKS
ncbi:tetratricopeptide repeat protein [Kitasatospora sp. NPDC001547]|uniref:tetratricopeptide repeat protein n=1 Tax=Kitasatospora sp. NPDC001547 TaxID=3364015 RepID=UPI00367E8059